MGDYLVYDNVYNETSINDYTRDNTLMMGSDKILTLAEPTPTLLEKYLNLIEE